MTEIPLNAGGYKALPANYAYTLREVAAYAAVLQRTALRNAFCDFCRGFSTHAWSSLSCRLIMKEVRIAFKAAGQHPVVWF